MVNSFAQEINGSLWWARIHDWPITRQTL